MQLTARLLPLLILSAAALTNISCSKNEPDQQTLHFTTKHDIKTTLDTELEVYRVDNNPHLFYINFRYYTRTKTGQWSFAASPDGPWKTFPDQAMAPMGLQLLAQ